MNGHIKHTEMYYYLQPCVATQPIMFYVSLFFIFFIIFF